MYMEKENLFCISLPICCFEKAASLRGRLVRYIRFESSVVNIISRQAA